MATTTSTTLSNQYQNYFTKKLLGHAVQELRLNEFAKQAELPKNLGSKVISFFRPGVGDASQVQTLTEGTPISTFRDVTLTRLDVPLIQYGEAAKITDVVTMTSLFDALEQSIQTMGEDCALHADGLTRDALAHPTTGLSKMYAQDLAAFANLVSATLALGSLKTKDLLRAATRLMINRAPRLEGGYVAVVPPQCSFDIKNDSAFVEAVKYTDAKRLFKGEIGTIHGIRVVEATNPFQEDETEGTFASSFNVAGSNTTGLIYTTMVVGRDAFGTPKLAGTQSPWKPSIIIVDKPDSGNPAGQFKTAAWKSFWASAVLNQNWGVALRAKSTFVG